MLRCGLLIRCLLLGSVTAWGFAWAYAIAPPPPGEIAYLKKNNRYDYDGVETYQNITVSRDVNLYGDVHGTVNFIGQSESARLSLDGYRVTIDSNSGIMVNRPRWSIISGNGILTSNQPDLNIVLKKGTLMPGGGKLIQYGLNIESVIAGSMGLRISGNHTDSAVVYLSGSQSNTFTGNVHVSGGNNYLALRKTGGAIAVMGDISVSSWAVLRFDESQQVRTTSNVTLTNATLYHSTTPKELTTRFHRLTVSGSIGVVSFGSAGTHAYKRYLYLDELVIEGNAHIEVNEWAPDRDFFLVRKTMNKEQLESLMSKIIFRGWLPGRTHLESYNKDYWAISGTPEPKTYGAIFGAVGVGLVAWRQCRRTIQNR